MEDGAMDELTLGPNDGSTEMDGMNEMEGAAEILG